MKKTRELQCFPYGSSNKIVLAKGNFWTEAKVLGADNPPILFSHTSDTQKTYHLSLITPLRTTS